MSFAGPFSVLLPADAKMVLTPAGSERALGVVFPDGLASAVHLEQAIGTVARNQKVAVGQAGHHRHLLDVEFQKQLALRVVLGDFVAAVLGHDDLAIGRNVQPGVRPTGSKGMELFAAGIEAHAGAVLAHHNDVAVAGLVSAGKLAQVVDELAHVFERKRHVLAVGRSKGTGTILTAIVPVPLCPRRERPTLPATVLSQARRFA
jgi:hypothetical protein